MLGDSDQRGDAGLRRADAWRPRSSPRDAHIEQVLADPAQEPWAVAVIAPQDDVFWLGRLYEALRVGSPARVRVFRNTADAEDWLQRQPVG